MRADLVRTSPRLSTVRALASGPQVSTGTLDEPQASVNPLSALAPGWLRGIFSGEGKGEEPTVFPEGKGR